MFLARFTAAWVYAEMGTVAVALLEKQQQYRGAVELLQLLLGGNACVGRRGEWWTRLAINLEHLGQAEDALEVGRSLGGGIRAWVEVGKR
jgi:Fanconi-associated nuclease 1